MPTVGSLNPDQADAIKFNWANMLVFHVVSKEDANENDPALTFSEVKKVLDLALVETTTVNRKETTKSISHRECTQADFGDSDLAKEYFNLFEGQLLLCPSMVKEATPPITDIEKWKTLPPAGTEDKDGYYISGGQAARSKRVVSIDYLRCDSSKQGSNCDDGSNLLNELKVETYAVENKLKPIVTEGKPFIPILQKFAETSLTKDQ